MGMQAPVPRNAAIQRYHIGFGGRFLNEHQFSGFSSGCRSAHSVRGRATSSRYCPLAQFHVLRGVMGTVAREHSSPSRSLNAASVRSGSRVRSSPMPGRWLYGKTGLQPRRKRRSPAEPVRPALEEEFFDHAQGHHEAGGDPRLGLSSGVAAGHDTLTQITGRVFQRSIRQISPTSGSGPQKSWE